MSNFLMLHQLLVASLALNFSLLLQSKSFTFKLEAMRNKSIQITQLTWNLLLDFAEIDEAKKT